MLRACEGHASPGQQAARSGVRFFCPAAGGSTGAFCLPASGGAPKPPAQLLCCLSVGYAPSRHGSRCQKAAPSSTAGFWRSADRAWAPRAAHQGPPSTKYGRECATAAAVEVAAATERAARDGASPLRCASCARPAAARAAHRLRAPLLRLVAGSRAARACSPNHGGRQGAEVLEPLALAAAVAAAALPPPKQLQLWSEVMTPLAAALPCAP